MIANFTERILVFDEDPYIKKLGNMTFPDHVSFIDNFHSFFPKPEVFNFTQFKPFGIRSVIGCFQLSGYEFSGPLNKAVVILDLSL